MNILLINYEFPPLGGGGGSFSRDLAEELAGRNNNVDVLTSGFPGLEKEETVNGVRVFRIPVPARNSLYYATMPSLVSFPFMAIPKGLGLIKKNKYDVINTHFAVPSGPAGSVLSSLSGIPNVLSLHGSDIYNPVSKKSPHRLAPLRWAVRSSLTKAARVVANSNYIRDCAIDIYSPKREIDVIPLGMTAPVFSSVPRSDLSMQEYAFYVVSVGRMAKVKGFDILLKTIKLMKTRGSEIHLLLIGDGPERKNLEDLSELLGITDQVHFKGWVQGEEKFQYLAASDAYVMSSIHEGFGVVLLEAMAAGLPLIATNTGGQTDIIKNEKSG
ncbi:glycosyltransferase, partial [Candidatus Omnitrophota bacterium]